MSNDTLGSSQQAVEQAAARKSLLPRAGELINERRGGLPVWVRAPVRGPEHFTGLSRAKLYDLTGKGQIRSRFLREPGAIRGCRLFDLRSILDYIERAGVDGGQ